MSLYNTEEKISKIAEEVARDFRAGQHDLDTLVRKYGEDYMLTNPEIEVLTGKANHLVFKEKFAQDRLATYKIAKYENILKVDRTMNIVEYKVASYADPLIEKAAGEETPGVTNIEDVKLTPNTAPLLAEAGEANISDLKGLRSKYDGEIESIKNRVKMLLREGESLDNIYGVLRDNWGIENREELDQFFAALVESLKKDGYVKNTEYSYDAKVDNVSDKEPLKTASCKLLKTAEQIVLHETAHEIIMRKLAGSGYDLMAMALETKMPEEYYGAKCNLYRSLRNMNKTAAGVGKIPVSEALGSAILGGLVLGGSLKVLDAATSAVDSIRKGLWEDKLKKRYPELNQIPEERYRDIYRSIVGLEQELLKAPYALKEMIKAHDEYGTMDSGTILKLLETGRKGHPNASVVASNMGKMVMMQPGLSLGGA